MSFLSLLTVYSIQVMFQKTEYTVCTGGIQNFEFLPFVSFFIYDIYNYYYFSYRLCLFCFCALFQTCCYAKNIEINMKCISSQIVARFPYFLLLRKKQLTTVSHLYNLFMPSRPLLYCPSMPRGRHVQVTQTCRQSAYSINHQFQDKGK